jgi:hypothetical protein
VKRAVCRLGMKQKECRREIAAALSDDVPEARIVSEALMIFDMRAAKRPPARHISNLAHRVAAFDNDYVSDVRRRLRR